MSQENVEVIRALMPEPDTDVAAMFRQLRDPELAEVARKAVDRLFHPEFEAVAFYTPTRYRGPDGLRDFWLDWLEPWATYYIGIETIVADGDRVLVRSHDRGRRHDMDEEVEVRGGSIWTFKGGKIVLAEFLPSGQGVESAWVSE